MNLIDLSRKAADWTHDRELWQIGETQSIALLYPGEWHFHTQEREIVLEAIAPIPLDNQNLCLT